MACIEHIACWNCKSYVGILTSSTILYRGSRFIVSRLGQSSSNAAMPRRSYVVYPVCSSKCLRLYSRKSLGKTSFGASFLNQHHARKAIIWTFHKMINLKTILSSHSQVAHYIRVKVVNSRISSCQENHLEIMIDVWIKRKSAAPN
jgi:hypothetical protein